MKIVVVICIGNRSGSCNSWLILRPHVRLWDCSHQTRMLRIRMLSGEEVSVPVQEVSCVREVKRRLHQLHGLPPRFRQRLILHGTNLDDAYELDSPLELELILQSFSGSGASQKQADELVAAAGAGLVGKAGVTTLHPCRLNSWAI